MKTTTNLQQLLLSQEISNHLLAYTFFQRSPSLANQYIIELTVHSIFFPDSFIQAPDSLKRTNLPIKELTILEKNNTRISKNNLILLFSPENFIPSHASKIFEQDLVQCQRSQT